MQRSRDRGGQGSRRDASRQRPRARFSRVLFSRGAPQKKPGRKRTVAMSIPSYSAGINDLRGPGPLEPPTEKRCARCGQWLPLEAFRPNPRLRSGLGSWCKACHAKRMQEWRKRIARSSTGDGASSTGSIEPQRGGWGGGMRSRPRNRATPAQSRFLSPFLGDR
jgi:hypothetical protein